MLISPAAGAWLSGMPDFLLLLWDDGRMAPVPMRPSFTGARVEIISERCLWVTSATFGLGGRVSLTATELSSEYLRRCTLAWVMAKNFARGTSIRAGFCRSRCTSSCPQVIWIEDQSRERSQNYILSLACVVFGPVRPPRPLCLTELIS